jgi:hypothetical protein
MPNDDGADLNDAEVAAGAAAGAAGAAGAVAAGAAGAVAAGAAAAIAQPIAPNTPLYLYPSADGLTIEEGYVNTYLLPDGTPLDRFVAGENYGNPPHELIATGGFSRVYKLNFRSPAYVETASFVLKILNPNTRTNSIIRETLILQQLKGKWFAAQIIAAGIIPGGESYILYPYVEGLTLRDLQEAVGVIDEYGQPTGAPIREDYRILFQYIYNSLIDATNELHEMGFIHHDIKPDNIWVFLSDESTRPFFLDFGLAAEIGEPTGIQGTPEFLRMSRYKRPATANINWYALGKTFKFFNPNSAGRPLYRNLLRPNVTNNMAKAVRYEGGGKTRGKPHKKRMTRRFRRKL